MLLFVDSVYLLMQIVEVLEEEEEGWWKGKIGSREGVFPSNFVEEITEEEPKAHVPSSDLPPSLVAAPAVDPLSGDRRELAC